MLKRCTTHGSWHSPIPKAEPHFPCNGQHHSGLSIYKEGKRIPLDWRLTCAAETTIASGTLEYG